MEPLGNVVALDCKPDGAPTRVVLQFGALKLDVSIQDKIGEGSFGVVHRASCVEYPNFALKLCRVRLDRLREEISVMQKVCAQNPLTPAFIFGAISDAHSVGVVAMELCIPLTLHDFLVCDALPHPDALAVAHQLLAAVSSVHHYNCVHRDIKLQNFVFDTTGSLRIIDFGLASEISSVPSAGDIVAGTPSFMAPEMAHNALTKFNGGEKQVVGTAADVWSLGVVFFSLVTRRSPYPKMKEDNPRDATKALLRTIVDGGWLWPSDIKVDRSFKALISSMLQLEPSKRPTIDTITKNKLWAKRTTNTPSAIKDFLSMLRNSDEGEDQLAAEQPPTTAASMPSIDITASTTKTLVKFERQMRTRLQKVLLENLEEMQWRVWMWKDEVTEREVLQCVMETQMQNAKHPHRFLKKLGVPKGYECGFVCDECGVDVPLDASSEFYHCSCGMDLCITCHDLYVAKCTCTNCGKVLPNRIALEKHIAAQSCVKRPRMEGLDYTDEVVAPKPKPPAENKSKKTKANPSPTVVASLATASAAVTAALSTEAAEHNPPAFHQQQVSSEPWSAFDGMISKRMKKETATLPTPAEERQLLQGEWIRFFHHFPPSGDVPTALTYHIQPGRTGAIFNEHGVTIHSAVVSPFERQCYVVESIDMEGEDTVFLLSLEAAKVQFSYEVDLIQQAAFHHSKMLKLRRAPGTMSIYQVPTTAVRCFGDPVVYARWVLADTTQNITLFSLSNGHMQAFVNDSYEIRWMENEERKFCVRSNGRCELINEATCAVMPYIDALLDQTFVNDEDTVDQ